MILPPPNVPRVLVGLPHQARASRPSAITNARASNFVARPVSGARVVYTKMAIHGVARGVLAEGDAPGSIGKFESVGLAVMPVMLKLR